MRRFLGCIGATVALLAVGSLLIAAESGAHWSYAGASGPASWGTLERDYSSCALGKTQSPIDIPDNAVRTADLSSLVFDYRPASLSVVDNGHTIQVNYPPGSS